MGGVFAASVGIQDRAPTPPAASCLRRYGRKCCIPALCGNACPDRTQEHLALATGEIGDVAEPDRIKTPLVEDAVDQIWWERRIREWGLWSGVGYGLDLSAGVLVGCGGTP